MSPTKTIKPEPEVYGPYPLAMQAHPTLRQSLLAAFDDCPLQARLALDHEGGHSDHLQAMGTVFHRFAASCLTEMYRQGEDHIEVDVAVAIMSETLRQADVPLDEIVAIPMKHVADLRWMAIKWARDNRFSTPNLVDVEQRLNYTIQYPDGLGGHVDRVLTGQVDALFIENDGDHAAGHAIILDWKSGWKLPPASDVSDSGYFQQRFYGMLVMKAYPSVQRVTLREGYVRFSQVREAFITRASMGEIEAEMAALAERFDRVTNAFRAANDIPAKRAEKLGFEVDAGAFRPAPGAHCSYCPAPLDCPVYPQARKVGQIRTPEEAQLIAAGLVVAESAMKQHQGALKAWTAVHGPTRIRAAKDPNRKWGPVASTRTERPSQEAMENAIANGVDPRTLYRESVYTRFSAHSAPDAPREPVDDLLEEALADSIERAVTGVTPDSTTDQELADLFEQS